jgi:exosortase D (VPLPA-CTERM-specific)
MPISARVKAGAGLLDGQGVSWKGRFWFALAILGALPLFWFGLAGLAEKWARPEYSHGPVIPLLSFYLFLRETRAVPPVPEPVTDRWVGVAVIALALLLAAFGNMVQIDDLVFYTLIVWTAGLILTGFGFRRGWVFWPAVLHLVFMLPLPQVLYWQVSTTLQLVSSELGVGMLRLIGVPVFLEGNIIDLGVYQLQVAEACSGLRYLFPIMSFTYVFCFLYRGPIWHRVALLLAAVPLAVLMNALRIAVIGWLVDRHGIGQAEGFLHVFEGWAVFLACIGILFLMAMAMQRLSGDRRRLGEALDLDFSGIGGELGRILGIPASRALIAAAGLTVALSLIWTLMPSRTVAMPERDPYALFPHQIDGWSGTTAVLAANVERTLGADDYVAALYQSPGEAAPVDLFLSYYFSQTAGSAIHSPEVCLPSAGWEVAAIAPVTVELPGTQTGSVRLNRVVIQKGTERQLVYYWFEGRGRQITNDIAAKLYTLADTATRGRSDGGLVRLITPMADGEAAAAARLDRFLAAMADRLPRFLPE